MQKRIHRFQRILKTRQQERDLVQAELVRKQKEEEQLVGRIQQVHQEKECALTDFCRVRTEPLSPQTLWYERQNLDQLERILSDSRERLDVCRQGIEETKHQLLERHRNVRILEQYIERLEQLRQKGDLLAEQNLMDEISSQRFLFHQQEG
ncbi:flagellar export protein FliJ [Aminomonas paucivorans]|uniref:flagellar export protein FliJ n=1 Tax=Aminomonas paucivorans TaxID=81412 RepID=UPI00332AFE7A